MLLCSKKKDKKVWKGKTLEKIIKEVEPCRTEYFEIRKKCSTNKYRNNERRFITHQAIPHRGIS